MKVRMNRSCANSSGSFQRGTVYDVTDSLANAWLSQGAADVVGPDAGSEPGGLDELKKDELVALAADRGLSTDGSKADLVERLREADGQ